METVKEVHVSTGVDMYLEEQAVVARNSAVSGVEKYLASQQEKQVFVSEQVSEELVSVEDVDVATEEVEVAVVTGVDRYLRSKPEAEEKVVELSGVDKYMERQTVLAKEKAIANATGVERYLLSAAG